MKKLMNIFFLISPLLQAVILYKMYQEYCIDPNVEGLFIWFCGVASISVSLVLPSWIKIVNNLVHQKKFSLTNSSLFS